jgi:hypothetical protein
MTQSRETAQVSRPTSVVNDSSRLARIVMYVMCHVHRPSARAVDLSAVVDDGRRDEGVRARFDLELSKIVADETLPRRAVTKLAL